MSETSTVDAATERARREIDLIREYRTRLISDVVTGKLDVRGSELPEVDEPEVQYTPSRLVDLEAEALSEGEEVPIADL